GDPRWAGADSRVMLRHVEALLRQHGWRVGNVDSVVVCEAPKLAPHVEAMRTHIAADLAGGVGAVSVKATTSERLGFTGRGEGIAAHAVALLERRAACARRSARRCCGRSCARDPRTSSSTRNSASSPPAKASTCCFA